MDRPYHNQAVPLPSAALAKNGGGLGGGRRCVCGGAVVRVAGRRAEVLNPESESLPMPKMFPLAVKALHEVELGVS